MKREHRPERGTRAGRRVAGAIGTAAIVGTLTVGLGVGGAGVALAGGCAYQAEVTTVKVVKTDAASGKTLPGAVFHLTVSHEETAGGGESAIARAGTWQSYLSTERDGGTDAEKKAEAASDRAFAAQQAASGAVDDARAALAQAQSDAQSRLTTPGSDPTVDQDAVDAADAAYRQAQEDNQAAYDQAVADGEKAAQTDFDAATADYAATVADLQQQADAAYATAQQEKQWLDAHSDLDPMDPEYSQHYDARVAAVAAYDRATARIAVMKDTADDHQVALGQSDGTYDDDHQAYLDYVAAQEAQTDATTAAQEAALAAQQEANAQADADHEAALAAARIPGTDGHTPTDAEIAADPAVKKAQSALDAAEKKLAAAEKAVQAAQTALQKARTSAQPDKATSANVTTGADGTNSAEEVYRYCNGGDELTLTETDAPDGYVLADGAITLTRSGDVGAPWVLADAPDGVAITQTKPVNPWPGSAVLTTSTVTVTVPNKPVEKPSTPVEHEKPAPPVEQVEQPTTPIPTTITAGSGTTANPAGEVAGIALISMGIAGAGAIVYRRKRATGAQ